MIRYSLLAVLLWVVPPTLSADSHESLAESETDPRPPSLTLRSASPGGVAVVPFVVTGGDQPAARFGQRNLMIAYRDSVWYAFVGLSSSLLPGNYVVNTYSESDEARSVEFAVLAQAPTFAEDESDRGNDRVTSLAINSAMQPIDTTTFTSFSSAAPDLDLRPVAESRGIVPYGATLDDDALQPQDYLHYHTRSGAQVYAPAAGIVQRIVDGGQDNHTIYLDHGAGMISVLGNLRDPLVAVTQVVQRGEQLATTGQGEADVDGDGNADGAVDWGVQLNGWLVDPAAINRIGIALSTD